MQKILNILFIFIILAIASITPLNRALLEINIFAPVVETNEETVPVVTEEIHFIGIEGIRLAGREDGTITRSEEYWTDVNPDTHLLGFIKSDEEFALKFLYTSNTGDFDTEIPQLKIIVSEPEGTEMAGKEFDIAPRKEDLAITELKAEFILEGSVLKQRLAQGYHRVSLVWDGAPLGHFVIAKDAVVGEKLMKFETSIPENSRVIKLYIPDIDGEHLIPVSRIYPASFYDYIQLFEALHKGANAGYGLKGTPAVAHTNAYWISNSESRIDYRSGVVADIVNPQLMYRAIGYTFAQLGNLKKTNVYVDKTLTHEFETPTSPFFYDYIAGEGGRLLITETPSGAADSASHILGFIQNMQDRHVLPPHCKLINCEQKEDALHIDISHYEDVENAEVFEPLLNLSAYSLGGIKNLIFNGRLLPEIKAFNMDS